MTYNSDNLIYPTQKSAKQALSPLVGTDCEPLPCLAIYSNEEDDDGPLTTLGWTATDPDTGNLVFLNAFDFGVDLDEQFQTRDLYKIQNRKQIPFILHDDFAFFILSQNLAYGYEIEHIKFIYSQKLAQAYASILGIEDGDWVLVKQYQNDSVKGLAWMNNNSSAGHFVPVWPQDNQLTHAPWRANVIQPNKAFEYRRTLYVLQGFDMTIREIPLVNKKILPC